jgi:hypothetical protein
VHSTILPKTHWSFYSTVDELDELIDNLNVRGVREHELKEKLIHERDRIVKSLKKASGVVGKLAVDDEDLAKVEKKETKKVRKTFSKTLKIFELIFFNTNESKHLTVYNWKLKLNKFFHVLTYNL